MPDEEEKIEFSEEAVDTNEVVETPKIDESDETDESGIDKSDEIEVIDESKEDKEPKVDESNKDKKVREKEIGFSDFLKERNINVEELVTEKPKKQVIERDYSDIPESEREIWKKMSNDTFNKLKPIYLEHAKLKVENENLKKQPIGKTVYGHPKSYMLTEDYESKVADAQTADSILKHWQLQLARIRRGETWKDLDQDKDGKFIISAEKDATAEAETEVLEHLAFAQEQNHDARKSLKEFVTSYGNSYENDYRTLLAAQEKYFPGYSDPKHPTQQVQKAIIDALPTSFKSNPLTSILAMTAANNAILMGKLQSAMKEINKLKGIKEDTKKAPPTNDKFVHGKETKGKFGEVKFSDFRRVRDEEI